MLSIGPQRRSTKFTDRFKEEEDGILETIGDIGSELVKGVSAGTDQLQGFGGGGRALVGSLLDDDELFSDGMEYYNEQMAEAAENAGEIGRIEDVDGFGDFARYSAYIVGNVIPSLIGGGGAGAVVGVAAKRAAMHAAGKSLAKKSADVLSKKQAANMYAASTVGREALAKRGLAGQMSGAMAFGTAAGAGESFTRILEETGEEAALTAIVTGLASGGLDAVAPMRVLKKILPQEKFRDAAEEVAGAVYRKKGLFGKALKEAAKTGSAESVTEMTQEIIQNAALEITRGLDLEESFIERMLQEGKQSQYLNAAVAGAIGGGAMGGFAGAVGKDTDSIEPTERQLALPAPEVDIDQEVDVEPDAPAERAAQQNERGGDKVVAARNKALGLPLRRAEKTAEEAAQIRAEAVAKEQGLPAPRPERTAEEATASRESIQAQIKAQIAGLPAKRDLAKKMLQEITDGTYRNEGVGETVTMPLPRDPEPAAEAPTEVSGALPDPASVSPPMGELVGRDVEYNGNKGLLTQKDDGFYVVTQDNGDVFIESGENKTANELGVVPSDQDLKFENEFQIDPDTKKFTLRGKEYTLARIIKDQDGNPLSLAVRDAKGKKKTIKERAVLNRAQAQMTPAPDFSQVKVEMDDLPASIQRKLIEQSDQEVIPDQVSAQEAIDIAQSMPNAESLVEAVEEAASFRAVPLAEDTYTPQTFTQTIRRPENTVLSEAIAEINKGQPSQRTDIDEAKIDSLLIGEKVPYQDGNSFVSVEDAEGTTPNAKAEIKSALVDLFDAGMPKAFLKGVNGIYVHGNILDDETNGVYEKTKGFVSIYSSLIKASSKDQSGQTNGPAVLRFVLAHELGHAFDVTSNHTANSPEFSVDVNAATTTHIDFELGSIMAELANNFNNKTELGLELAYPFGTAFEMFNARPEKGAAIIQQEAFAQSFAVFHSSPEILEQYAPVTYNYMKNLLQSEQIDNGQRQNTSTQDDAETSGVRGDVRPQTVLRDVQVQDGSGDRGDGGGSPVEKEASQELGQPPIQSDGDSAGRPLQLERTEVVLKATDKKPTFKKANNHEYTGEYIVTFADGDRYTLFFDENAKEAGDETYFISEDGKVADLDGMLGETRQETIDDLVAHRQKLIDAGENSYNLPLDPQVSSDTSFKAYDIITDHPEGKLKLTVLRKKFPKLEDNQFDQMIQDLTGPDSAPEDLMVVQDGVISHPETVQEIEEERLADERRIANADDMIFAPFSRVPEPDERSPVLPMGKVEQSLSDLLAENPNPTSEQLGSIVGAPKKRKGKESVEDVDVKPITLDELRGYVEDSLSKSDNLRWYDDFGNLFRELVGDANLDEASVIFGITSAQNAAENNLAETLHIMSLARKFDPVKQRKQFELAVTETRRPDGQKLKITGRQVTAISDLYANGDFEGGIKTTTYMQMVADRGRNEYNPFSVQDVHMSRVFGFRKKDFDKKSGALVDAAKFSGENEYRYGQYLTSVLADEFGMTPNQMQATLWFYAKDKLTPKNKGDEDKAKKKLEKLRKKAEAEGVEFDETAPRYGDGTPESSALYAAPEIQKIESMIADGTFDTSTPLADSLADGVRPRNKPAQKTTPFSTVNEREGLMDLARARSPKLIASAVAGKGRGLAFPDDTPIETLVQYNQDVMAAIVDDGGQIPILRELGIPHEIEESAGTFTGYEPSIMIRLLGGNLETANKLAPLLGDALLQDSVITSQAVYAQAGLPAFVVVKKDGSDFSREDAMTLAESMNPSKDPDGINFNQPMNDTLMFLDSRSMKEGFEYTELNAEEFYSKLTNELGDSYSVVIANTQGDYHGSDQYREAIEKAWNSDGEAGSSNIYDRTNASLYEPVRKVYNEYAEKLGIPKREAQSLDLLSSPPSKTIGKPSTNAIPEVNAAYQKFKAGEISQQDFDTVVRSTISEYDFVPTPATYDEMFGALNKNKKQKINVEIQDGEVVGLRLDIPAYTDHGVWVPTIHGDKTSHRATASITGVKFGDDKQPAKAQKVMEGGHKSPFAQMRGAFVNRTDAENEALSKEALNDPDWIQIGFDPRRHSYFYDRKTGQPILSADEVIQVGPLVLAKNATSEGKTSFDFLYSPPSPTSEEANAARNAVIREEKETVDKATGWIKKTFKRQLTSRGLLNEQVFQAKIARDGEFGAAEIDTRMYLNSYDKAVKEANLSEEQTALLGEAIATPLDQLNSLNLPDAVKQAIGGMRKYLDKMSIDYAQVVADQALALAENGKGEAAAAKIDLLNTIASNKGKYLNRSYQVFDDPKWANKVPKSVIDNARTFLESNGAKNADRIINTILKSGTAFDSLSSFISEGKLGSKDLSILKKRKDIAPEIMALMGEYTDPRINFVKTSTKMSRLLWNHRFLERVKFEGQRDGFLFTAEDAPTDTYVQIAPDSSDAMNPLNGLYTTPELAQGFEDAMNLSSYEGFMKSYTQLNSMVKYGKTVIAPTTVARNFMSASLFTIANGHFNWAKGGESLKSFKGVISGESSYFQSAEGASTAYLREIRRLGVIYDSPYAGELTKALEDFSNASDLDNKVQTVDGKRSAAKKGIVWTTNFAAKFYQYGDDFWKIIGFENMVDVLIDNKGLTREQAMPLAAERIRDTYPTYSLIGKGVQNLRVFPFVGTFVSFPAEIIRTTGNMFRYLKQDMADPDMRGHAMTKVAGMSAVSLGIYALQDAALRAFDVDEDEHEAIRLMSPTWSENSNILPTGRDDDGNLEYIDLTYLDPYAYWKKPINALMRDQPIDDAVGQAIKEMASPFLGVDIATNAFLEIYNNEKGSGGRVWNPSDTLENKAKAQVGHIISGVGPAIIQNVNRTAKAISGDVSKSGKRYELEDELKAWVGFRVTTFDPKISLHFKAYEFNEAKRDATSLLTSTFRDPNDLDDGELENAFDRASSARKEGYERMIKLVNAARQSGLSDTQLMMVLRSNGVTKKDSKAMIAGSAAEWTMSDSTLKNSIKKSDLLFGELTGRKFETRWETIQRMLKEEVL